jgi:hypothetical protein
VFEKYYATLQVLAWFRETGECQTITMPRTSATQRGHCSPDFYLQHGSVAGRAQPIFVLDPARLSICFAPPVSGVFFRESFQPGAPCTTNSACGRTPVYGLACNEKSIRSACPSVVIMDGQSVKTTERGGVRGFDAHKRVKGRKRHIRVDTLGLPIACRVESATSPTDEQPPFCSVA